MNVWCTPEVICTADRANEIAQLSAEILGLPTGLRDRSRQYDWNPARCQRMIVSGRRIANALRTEGNQR